MNRSEKIEILLEKLENAKKKDKSNNEYAIVENIIFFNAIKKLSSYIGWLLRRAPQIASEKLLEINDILPEYDSEMHFKLLEVERKKIPGLISPVVSRLEQLIYNNASDMVVMDFGSGGMEIERQIISKIHDKSFKRKLVFIGIDQSLDAQDLAQKNLYGLGIEIYKHDFLDSQKLKDIINNMDKSCAVVLCRNDIFQLNDYFQSKSIDITFHSLFKHHLDEGKKKALDDISVYLSKCAIEYDGYKSWPMVVPQTIVGWNDPVFLNAEIFSNLRFVSKYEIIKKNLKSKVLFFKIGYYLLEHI